MIKYLGSKRLLVDAIVATTKAFNAGDRVLDLFSGTARVGHGLKAGGMHVTSNDHLAYAATLARCLVQADRDVWKDEATQLLDELSKVQPRAGYFTKTFCEEARFFQPQNGARIDAVREAIEARTLHPELKAIALTSLMLAADRVDSTTGVQMAYLKKWAKRSFNDLDLRMPPLLPGPGRAISMDAAEAATTDVDIAYLDPPYNQHSYLGNYHAWETLVRWDNPEAYGVARKRIHCKTEKSAFNSKRQIRQAFQEVIDNLKAPNWIVSFNNEGYLSREELTEILQEKGHVRVVTTDFKRYVGAQIGIYDPSGKKVGKVSHLKNKEFLFIGSSDPKRAEQAAKAAHQALLNEAS